MSDEAREVALARVAGSPRAAAFTGADLQAVVDTAQLTAIHCYLEVRYDRWLLHIVYIKYGCTTKYELQESCFQFFLCVCSLCFL